MRPKAPPFQPNESREEREQKLREFILAAVDDRAAGREDAVAVLARSPDSPVMRALLSVSAELAAKGAGASIILAGGAVAAEDETWSIVFSSGFTHEIRLTANPRVLDAHEQIVVGDRATWFGDSMRRDPWKRDAFASFLAGAPEIARGARHTFGRLWQSAHSIYRNPALASVVVSPATSEGLTTPQPAAPIAVASAAAAKASDVAAGLGETLAAWQPLTRH